MLGGEPLLNKDIVNIIYMTKDVWNIQDDQEYELLVTVYCSIESKDYQKR